MRHFHLILCEKKIINFDNYIIDFDELKFELITKNIDYVKKCHSWEEKLFISIIIVLEVGYEYVIILIIVLYIFEK